MAATRTPQESKAQTKPLFSKTSEESEALYHQYLGHPLVGIFDIRTETISLMPCIKERVEFATRDTISDDEETITDKVIIGGELFISINGRRNTSVRKLSKQEIEEYKQSGYAPRFIYHPDGGSLSAHQYLTYTLEIPALHHQFYRGFALTPQKILPPKIIWKSNGFNPDRIMSLDLQKKVTEAIYDWVLKDPIQRELFLTYENSKEKTVSLLEIYISKITNGEQKESFSTLQLSLIAFYCILTNKLYLLDKITEKYALDNLAKEFAPEQMGQAIIVLLENGHFELADKLLNQKSENYSAAIQHLIQRQPSKRELDAACINYLFANGKDKIIAEDKAPSSTDLWGLAEDQEKLFFLECFIKNPHTVKQISKERLGYYLWNLAHQEKHDEMLELLTKRPDTFVVDKTEKLPDFNRDDVMRLVISGKRRPSLELIQTLYEKIDKPFTLIYSFSLYTDNAFTKAIRSEYWDIVSYFINNSKLFSQQRLAKLNFAFATFVEKDCEKPVEINIKVKFIEALINNAASALEVIQIIRDAIIFNQKTRFLDATKGIIAPSFAVTMNKPILSLIASAKLKALEFLLLDDDVVDKFLQSSSEEIEKNISKILSSSTSETEEMFQYLMRQKKCEAKAMPTSPSLNQ